MNTLIRIAAVCTLVVGMCNCHYVTADPQISPQQVGNAWTAETWSGNNAPYSDAKMRIGREVETSKDPTIVVEQYKQRALLKPNDPFSVFCWATAVSDAFQFATSSANAAAMAEGVRAALETPPSPHTYEYARVRYLFEIDENKYAPYLFALGNRLLSANRKDAEVLRMQGVSCQSDFKAIPLFTEAIKIDPNDRRLYAYLGVAYADAYQNYGASDAYGRNGVQLLRKYLSMSPLNKDGISIAQTIINVTNTMLAKKLPPKIRQF